MQWENVHIFISSTFNDMHAERDYLVKSVFPALSEWCEERKLRLIDIDLRWGVTAADSEAKNTVRACLRNIDECRPFFLCFLGQRRGWVPSTSDIAPDTYELFPKLMEKHYVGETSVTEMEILHALVDPLHNGILRNTKDDTRSGQAAEHAFFYLRDPGYLKTIPHPDLRAIYTNESEHDPKTADAELTRWREQEIPRTARPVNAYTSGWQTNESTPEIALPLCVPTTAPRHSETWKNAFTGWKKRWASAGVAVDGSGEISGAELEKAKAYNKNLTSGRLGNFRANGLPLAEIIIEQLKTAIAARFPGHMTITAQTPLQKELDQQAQFLRIASEGFIERAGDFDALNDYLKSETETRPFAVTANAGMGKTSFLAHFIDTYSLPNGESLHYRFIGGSDDSVSAERLVRSLLFELKETGKVSSDIPASPTEMMNKLPELLAEAGKKGKTTLIIDALNQLETGMDDLHWIPETLPQNIKLIVSFKRGEESAEKYYLRQKESGEMILHSIKPFENKSDRKALVAAYLEQYFKELDEPRIQSLISADGADNPLFLKAALSELRVFGVHNDLSEVIRNRFGNTPVKAFDAILSRMESDPAHATLTPAAVLPRIFGWLAHSRFGLSVKELTDLLLRERLTDKNAEAQDAVYLTLRQLRAFLAKRDGRIDFFYESFKIAAVERYTGNHPLCREPKRWHQSLAEYFETLPLENLHKLMEQAWQYAHAGMGAPLKALLWDFRFMRERLKTGADAIINDYKLILLPENGMSNDDISNLRLLLKFFSISPDIFAQWPDQLSPRLFGTLSEETSCPEIPMLLEQIVRETKTAWLKPEKNLFESLKTRLIIKSPIHTGIFPNSNTINRGMLVVPQQNLLIASGDQEKRERYSRKLSIYRLDNLRCVRTIQFNDVYSLDLFAVSANAELLFIQSHLTKGISEINILNLKTGILMPCRLEEPFNKWVTIYSADFSSDNKDLLIYCGVQFEQVKARLRSDGKYCNFDNYVIRYSVASKTTTKIMALDKDDSDSCLNSDYIRRTIAYGTTDTEFYYTGNDGLYRFDMMRAEKEQIWAPPKQPQCETDLRAHFFKIFPDKRAALLDCGYFINLLDKSGFQFTEPAALTASEDGMICVLSPLWERGLLELWNIAIREKIGTLKISGTPFHIAGSSLFIANPEEISIYDITLPLAEDEDAKIYACKNHIETVQRETRLVHLDQCVVRPDKKYIMDGGSLLKLSSDGIYRTISHHGDFGCFGFSPDSRTLLTVVSRDGCIVEIFDVETNNLLYKKILEPERRGLDLLHSAHYIDGKNIIISFGNIISVLDIFNELKCFKKWKIMNKNTQQPLMLGSMCPFGMHWLVSCYEPDHNSRIIVLLDLDKEKVLRYIELDSDDRVKFLVVMKGLLITTREGKENSLFVWDVASEKQIAKINPMNFKAAHAMIQNDMIICFDNDQGPNHSSATLTLENAPKPQAIQEPSEAASRVSLVALETDSSVSA